MPPVTIIILNWNNPTDTLACLESIFRLDYPNFTVLVVDNGSTDDSVARIRARYPDLPLLVAGENLGFAGGNNAGIRRALGEGAAYVWLLNDDAIVAPDSLTILMRAARETNAGFLGPMVRIKEQPDHILAAGGVYGRHMRPGLRGLGEWDAGQYTAPERVGFLSGCALLVDRRAIDAVGALDEAFFAYGEDVEWCYRGQQVGFDVLFVPGALAWHPDTRLRDGNSRAVTYYISRNHLLFIRKHHLGAPLLISTLAQYAYWLVNWSVNPKWRESHGKRDALWWATRDFARGRFGKSADL